MFPINVCGTIYPYPNVGENPWGIEHIQWAIAVSNCVTANQIAIASLIGTGFVNPMTTDGDIIYQNLGVPTRLPAGTDGEVLVLSGGLPTWGSPSNAVQVTPADSGVTVISVAGVVDIPNMSLTVTLPTADSAVIVTFFDGNIQMNDSSNAASDILFYSLLGYLKRDAVIVSGPARYSFQSHELAAGIGEQMVHNTPPSMFRFYDKPGASGVYNYNFAADIDAPLTPGNPFSVTIDSIKMMIQIVREV